MSAITRLAVRARSACASTDGTVPSPCVSVCRMEANGGVCEGCLRTLDEIAGWSDLDDDGKREVWQAIAQRITLQRRNDVLMAQ